MMMVMIATCCGLRLSRIPDVEVQGEPYIITILNYILV